jgi:hypothetical protein
MSTQTHWKALVNPHYIGAYSLNPGEERIVTIEKVVREMVKGPEGKEEECTVAHLKREKPFILNKTNCKIIAKVYGTPYIEDWSGKSIKIYAAKVKAFGDMVDALRIKAEIPKVEKPNLTPDHPRWEEAKKALKSGNTTVDAIRKHYVLTATNEKNLLS